MLYVCCYWLLANADVDVEGWSLEETYTAVHVFFFVEIVKMDIKLCFYAISLDFTDFTQF